MQGVAQEPYSATNQVRCPHCLMSTHLHSLALARLAEAYVTQSEQVECSKKGEKLQPMVQKTHNTTHPPFSQAEALLSRLNIQTQL